MGSKVEILSNYWWKGDDISN